MQSIAVYHLEISSPCMSRISAISGGQVDSCIFANTEVVVWLSYVFEYVLQFTAVVEATVRVRVECIIFYRCIQFRILSCVVLSTWFLHQLFVHHSGWY